MTEAEVLSFSPAFQNMCTFISAASKVVQLQHLWQTKDSGQASALTWGMSVYTCAGKLQRAWCEVLSPPNASFHRSFIIVGKDLALVCLSADAWDSDTTVF